MSNKKIKDLIKDFDEENASVLASMIVDPQTSEAVRLQIINELNETSKSETFFETMFNEELSVGCCPYCAHKNHWLIPEEDLNQMGWVTSKKDQRVKVQTTSNDCEEFAESCSKKKTTI